MSAVHATIRRRIAADMPELVDALMRQQPLTRYPLRSPLPFPPERFLHADDAAGAWTAETEAGLVGHATWLRDPASASQRGVHVPTGRATTAAEACAEAHGCGVDELGWVSALFVTPAARGMGLGPRLLATVVADVRAAGLHPCLEVLDLNEAAGRRYRADGWREVLRARPDWLAEAVDDPATGTSTMVLLAER